MNLQVGFLLYGVWAYGVFDGFGFREFRGFGGLAGFEGSGLEYVPQEAYPSLKKEVTNNS